MTESDLRSEAGIRPRRPLLVATLIFVLAALILCWPMLSGQFLASSLSDQFEAGYSFRHFAAQYFREHGAIPLWNPYLFGGLPFVGAAHGDIFYPTAWLRWILPTDTAMNLGFAGHIVIAGVTMYGFLRASRVPWAAAVIGGLAYELSGMVASQVQPGHDGKLFVSAMAPLFFMGILIAVRDRRLVGYACIALATGLALQGHPQTSYYLLVAGLVFGLFLVFGWDEGPRGRDRIRVIAGAVGAVGLGVGLYAIYLLPMMEYVPYSPRSGDGMSTGWEYMTNFSMPIAELAGTVLPELDGIATPTYFGGNPLKLHGEYLGPIVLMLAVAGVGGKARKRERLALGAVGALFLLVALGRYTPFYRLWYELMPLMQKLRAPGMAFYLPSLVISVFAGFGAERLLAGRVPGRRTLITGGIIAGIGLLGALGALQPVAEDIGRSSGRPELAIANAGTLQAGGVRLLLAALVGGALVWAIARGRIGRGAAFAALGVVLVADLWSVDRRYFRFSPPAEITYANDDLMARVAQTPKPYRAWAPDGYRYGQLNPYPRAWLMAAGIPTLFGYHGNQLHFFDELLGGKEDWQNQLNPNMHRMFAIRYAIVNQQVELPGYHEVMGPVTTTLGQQAWLYEADTAPPYAWVVGGAAKLPEADLIPTVNDPRFPVDRLVVYSDTTAVAPGALGDSLPQPSSVSADVTKWRAGRMVVRLTGAAPDSTYLVVAENWYPAWRAHVDGQPAPVHRANYTLQSVVLPPGAREVILEYRSSAYQRGRAVSLAAMAGVVALFAASMWRRRSPAGTA